MKKVMMMTGALAAMALQAETMLTPWGEAVTPENAWRGYPRPQMVRSNWTNLNGQWDYAITDIGKTDARPEKWDGKILVPYALEAPLSGCNGRLLEPHQYLWYTRKINLDPKPGEKILLHFGAVDFRAIVYLGHDEVGCTPHEGGQLPFTVDLTPYAKKGENTLTVLVWDPTEAHINSRGKQSFKTYACFYTRMSGIWQTVWMETVPEKHIADYDVVPDIDKGEVTLTFKVCGVADKVIASTDIRDIVHPYLRDLARMMGETVCLAVEDDLSVAYIDVVEGRFSIIRNMRRIGTVAPLHCTGMGKVLLFEADEEKLDRLVEEKGLERFTKNTITTRQDLEREIAESRARGWAYDNEECEIGARCIAFPIYNYTGKIVAAFSVTGLVARMSDAFLDSRLELLKETAAQISRELGYDDEPAQD